MKKNRKTVYRCEACAHEEARWLGRCPRCGEWNTLKEVLASDLGPLSLAGPGAKGNSLPLNAIKLGEGERMPTGIGEFDRVLGGGIMKKSCVLVGGEPGIGKSTLLLQAAASCKTKGRILYVSGEESAEQIRMRADRLGIPGEHIELFCSGEVQAILRIIETVKPVLIIIDSVQTLHSSEIGPVPGTVNQMKYCAHELITWIKERGSALLLVAHVTKDGVIAGPKSLEHMVDTVLYFEQNESDHRFLRAAKNRFGSVDELGIFLMGEKGLIPQEDSAALFLVSREGELPAGVATAAVLEGSRVLLLEIQALVVPAKGSISRVSSERIEASRVSRIAATIEKHLKLRLSDLDIYINVSGGVRVSETGVDLAIAAAIHSARTGVPLSSSCVFAGELSLAGELRPVRKMALRRKTAETMGFSRFIGPSPGRGELASPAESGGSLGTTGPALLSLSQAVHAMLS